MDKSRESEGLCLLATLKSLKYNELMDTPLPVGVVEVTGTGDPETVEAGLDPTADPNLDPSAEGWKTDPAEDTLDPTDVADATLDPASDFAEIADPALDSNFDLAEVADGLIEPASDFAEVADPDLDPCWDPGGKVDPVLDPSWDPGGKADPVLDPCWDPGGEADDPNPDSADIADPAVDPYCDPGIRSWLADPNLDIAGTLVADDPLDSHPLKKKDELIFTFPKTCFHFKMGFRMSFHFKNVVLFWKVLSISKFERFHEWCSSFFQTTQL